MSMYSVYVGKYDSPSATKNDLTKLNKLGFRGFVFSRNNHYSLKVYTSPDKDNINLVSEKLRKLGYYVEIEELTFNNR